MASLERALPPDWSLMAEPERRSGGTEVDALLRLSSPDGSTAVIVAEVSRKLEPRAVPHIQAQAQRWKSLFAADAVMIITSFASPLARERLAEAGLGWFDQTGNLRLRLDRPSVFIDRQGADRAPFTDPADRRLKSLRGPGAARVVRGLLGARGPVGVRALAADVGVGAGTSARVLELLDREGLVNRTDAGEVELVRKKSLVRRWVQDYGLMTSHEIVRMIDPRGVDHALSELRDLGDDHVLTGSAAARAYLPPAALSVVPLTVLTVYTRAPGVLERDLGLRATERGANVLLVRPFNAVVLEGAQTRDRLRCAPACQVVADLLTGPGRSSEEAEQLMDVLATDDPGWTL
ncbi:hypothetical protein NLX83_05570 [Allokutzneria sp. A3M-2-11 16]|uniref:hypothetical protein n=1 Tax=Allokutzneria sp. A3M-2-11 16 TaxID=2962043 RepID=UPI0020B8D514|nr:hypothetical protein [Allokutzneria sp. A3M-2-11 16]MCP3798721.1 hypothetical protein [Allokutzneria sp. A3M-2-11 16]